jgi:cbb3-type cytochrome oxidase subunit 3
MQIIFVADKGHMRDTQGTRKENMKRPNLMVLAIVAAISGLIGSQLFRSTQGTFLGGAVMLLCVLIVLFFIGYVAWVLTVKNQKIIKASDAEKDAALRFDAEPNSGVIYIYRSQYTGLLVGMNVMLDSALIGQTRGFCFYRVVVAPGMHVISGDKRCQASVSVDTAAGQIAYVEQEIVMSATKGGYQFKIAEDIANAQAAMRKSKLLVSSISPLS